MSSGQDAVGQPSESPATPEEHAPNQAAAQGAAPAEPASAANSALEASGGASSGGASSGPLSIERIRQLRAQSEPVRAPRPPRPTRQAEELAAAQEAQSAAQAVAQAPAGSATSPASPGTDAAAAGPGEPGQRNKGDRGGDRGKRKPFNKPRDEGYRPPSEPPMPKLEVPSRRAALPADLQSELESALAGTDLDRMLIGDKLVQVGHELEEGQRIQSRVLKVHGESVFMSLGGPNEGVISLLQFTDNIPEVGSTLEVIVRGYLAEEGLYDVTVPGGAISVADWDDLKEGEIVEAKVTAANTGGLECTVGQVRGFIPASQVAEYRIEDFSEFIDQKVLCVVTQANPSRGNLVLSRRAVLEREKAEKREQRLAELEVGSAVEGTVRKLMDFGAFVDIGGLDGLLHISQLSWEKVKHPSEVLQEGQKIQVRVDKVDTQSGKISLSYRSLQDHPWTGVETRFPVGAIVHGTVSRIADFGAFVRLATGVEGLVHLSELAHHRVHKVTNHVKEGQELDVKVLSVEPERQRMSLSLKAAQQPPTVESKPEEPEVEEVPRELALPKHRGPLKGGTGKNSGGELFGLKW
ncbi:MAG: S1 RNA-binding domain-containing protein [Pirellulaceae bacterium]|nr:S1 RNA-binding domain-containing protein [Pirellulaceae bacterium]